MQKFSGDCKAQLSVHEVSAPARRAHSTAARVQEIRNRLSARDIDIIQTLGMVQVASSRQLEVLHFSDLQDSSRARQRSAVLHRLTSLGLLARLPRRVGGLRAGSAGYVFALNILGQRLLGRSTVRTPPTRSWPFLAHALACTDLYVAAHEAEADGRLDFLRFIPEPQCWSWIEGDVPLRPDAIVSVKPAACDWIDHWAVEVDQATERPVRLRSKLLGYWEAYQAGGSLKSTSVFPRVLLTVPDEQRLEQCLSVIERLPVELAELVVVVLHEEAAALLASGGPELPVEQSKNQSARRDAR